MAAWVAAFLSLYTLPLLTNPYWSPVKLCSPLRHTRSDIDDRSPHGPSRPLAASLWWREEGGLSPQAGNVGPPPSLLPAGHAADSFPFSFAVHPRRFVVTLHSPFGLNNHNLFGGGGADDLGRGYFGRRMGNVVGNPKKSESLGSGGNNIREHAIIDKS